MVYIENSLIDSVGVMYFTVDSWTEISNIITDSNNITLRKVNGKSYGFDNMYQDKELIEDKFYRIINQFNEKEINTTKFYSILLNKIYSFFWWKW